MAYGGASFDSRGGGLVGINTVHERIHEGRFFDAGFVDTAFASAEVHDLALAPATGQAAHARIGVVCGGDARFILYEGSTVSADGTLIVPTNRNRFSSRAAQTVVRHNPTVGVIGTQIAEGIIAGGVGPSQSVGGSFQSFEEYILNPASAYVLRISNLSGSNQVLWATVNFYEP